MSFFHSFNAKKTVHTELIDFLNHGLLPLLGREELIDRIVKLGEGTLDRGELRSSLIIGEAGSGKSRLLEHLIPKFRRGRGVPLHLKLYPGVSVSFPRLLSEAIYANEVSRTLVSLSKEPTTGEAINGIRRIARLRPVTLILEDAHLLDGDLLLHVRNLLDALANEGIFFLCLSRPGAGSLKPLLASSLIETSQLHNLSQPDLISLWNQLFNVEPEPRTIDILWEATQGNPLAIRSALRGGIDSGALQIEADSPSEFFVVNHDRLGDIFVKSTQSLTTGMMLGLSDDERLFAQSLASLGEVFSSEGAKLFHEQAEKLLQRLSFKDIIGSAIAPPARLGGRVSEERPWAFTHTLLHQHLSEEHRTDPANLIELLVQNLPFYSFLPLEELAAKVDRLADYRDDHVLQGIDRLIEIAGEIYVSKHHQRAAELLLLIQGLYRQVETRLNADTRKEYALKLKATEIRFQIKEVYTDQFVVMLDELESLLSDDEREEHVPYKFFLFDLRHASWYARHGREMPLELHQKFIAEHDDLLKQSPSLRMEQSYVRYLQRLAQIAIVDGRAMNWVDTQLTTLLNTFHPDEEAKTSALQAVVPFLLQSFQTVEELEMRKEQLASLKGRDILGQLPLLFRVILFYEDTGQYEKALTYFESGIVQKYYDQGLLPQSFNLRVLYTRMRVALEGHGVDATLGDIQDVLEQLPSHYQIPACRFLSVYHANTAVCSGQYSVAGTILERYTDNTQIDRTAIARLLCSLNQGVKSLSEVVDSFDREVFDGEEPFLLAKLMLSKGKIEDSDLKPIQELLRAPTLSSRRLPQLHVLFTLFRLAQETRPPLATLLMRDVKENLKETCQWLVDHKLPGFLFPLLERYGEILPRKEQRRFKSEAAVLLKGWNDRFRSDTTPSMKLSLFGRVEAIKSDGNVIEVKGGRLRTLLSLMGAAPLLSVPLEHREFCFLAAGSDDMLEPEKARKTMNGGIFRLRDILGEDAIITDEEIPRLNSGALDIDLWNVLDSLDMIEQGLRSGTLAGLSTKMEELLAIIDGEVLFPSVYDDFFEALRSDVETRLRTLLLDLCQRLMREEDSESCEAILRKAMITMPGDEELVELLCEILETTGKRGEAERLRLTMT